MSDVTLYGLAPSTYVRTAMMALESKGVAYTLDPVEFRSDAHRALHPFGKIPSLRHGDVLLYETLAITTYVDEVFNGPALHPDSAAERARMMQWISVINGYLYDSLITRCVAERFVKPMRGQETDEMTITAARPDMVAHLDITDAALARTGWLAGDGQSLADMFLAPILFYFAATPEGKEMLPERANLMRWQDAMQQSPHYGRINSFG